MGGESENCIWRKNSAKFTNIKKPHTVFSCDPPSLSRPCTEKCTWSSMLGSSLCNWDVTQFSLRRFCFWARIQELSMWTRKVCCWCFLFRLMTIFSSHFNCWVLLSAVIICPVLADKLSILCLFSFTRKSRSLLERKSEVDWCEREVIAGVLMNLKLNKITTHCRRVWSMSSWLLFTSSSSCIHSIFSDQSLLRSEHKHSASLRTQLEIIEIFLWSSPSSLILRRFLLDIFYAYFFMIAFFLFSRSRESSMSSRIALSEYVGETSYTAN